MPRSRRAGPSVDHKGTVSVFGTNAAQSAAGVNNAERVAARDKAVRQQSERPSARRTRPDQPDEVVVSTESPDAVRNLAGNEREDAREDHQERGGYLPSGRGSSKQGSKRSIDVEG
jgi:hypothetical protein